MRTFLCLMLISAISFAQKPEIKLSETESLALKVSILEQELAKSKSEILQLNQQLALVAIYQAHGWSKDQVVIKLNRDGLPEAFLIPKVDKPPVN